MESSMQHSTGFEPLQEGRPLDSPLAPSASVRSSAASHYSSQYSHDRAVSRRVSQSSMAFSYTQDNMNINNSNMSRQASQSSFAQRYDQMASQIEEQLQTIPHTPEPDPEEQYQQGYRHQEEQYEDGYRQAQQYHQQQEQNQHDHSRDIADTPDRPHSTDTFQQAELAFKDFDGVHFKPDTEEYVAVDENGNEVRRVSARTSSGSLLDAAQVLRTASGGTLNTVQGSEQRYSRPMSTHMYNAGPTPQEAGMVYYPAPVPRMLNLPKRLSQLPSASVQAKRRTQLLNEYNDVPKEAPAPSIPKLDFDESEETTRTRSISEPLVQQATNNPRAMPNQRMSVANMRNLPPQLRASAYFEQPIVPQNVQMKHESAVATLESILAASATAPVTAFTDHPFAGDVRKSVYAMEKPAHNRKNTSTTLLSTDAPIRDLKKKRSSSIGNFFRRSSGDLLENEAARPSSRGSQMLDGMSEAGGKRLQKRKSQMSIADQLERDRTLQELEGLSPQDSRPGLVTQASNNNYFPEEGESLRQTSSQHQQDMDAEQKRIYTEGEQVAEDFREQDALSDVSDTDPIFAQPATLLAELQVRKAQLKNRTRTAAVAYPNGMHSTLLQLDAVEAINKKKRQKQKIALAWEDPHQRELEGEVNEDEDVPLGVLYPTQKDKGRFMGGEGGEWRRPMGLMEQREMEDSEPLSRRAERLNPGKIVARRPQQQRRMSEMRMMGGEEQGEDAARRMKTKEELDGAIAEVVATKPGSRPISTFSADVLSQFGGLDVKDAPPAPVEGEAAEPPEDETLGQRRARLQREREAAGEEAPVPARPALRSTNSMANLLSTNPVRAPISPRTWEGQQQPGGLLQLSAKEKARQKEELLRTNLRSSSVGNMMGSGPPIQMGRKSVVGIPGIGRSPPLNTGLFASPTAGVVGGMGYAPQPGTMGMMTPQQQALQQQQMAMQQQQQAYYAMMAQQQQQQQQQMMSMGMGMPGMQMPGMMGYPGMQQQQVPQQMYGVNAMGMPIGMNGMELPLDPRQRDAIDRWRMGIA